MHLRSLAGFDLIDKSLRVWRIEGGGALIGKVCRRLMRLMNITSLDDWLRCRAMMRPADQTSETTYADRMKGELAWFENVTDVHALPPIFNYWAEKFLTPKCRELDIPGVTEFFVRYVEAACRAEHVGTAQVASLGAGNCETEVAIAEQLLAKNVTNFAIDCIDVNGQMLGRGKVLAGTKGVAAHLRFVEADINAWNVERGYAVVIANQSLHHFQELELLFDKTLQALGENGRFVVSDVIGRNGHMRWPEALAVIHRIWRTMPGRYKYNHLLRRHEKLYENWDCSVGGFEGIRAQDILPLLIDKFHFELFFSYGNIADIFIDRAFGHNFDANTDADRHFIDAVGALDDELIAKGEVKPTHLIAVMRSIPCGAATVYRHLTPRFCLRLPDAERPV
ncbi:MAG: class I SAM-dependent methyltransferase [Nitrospira sp.]|nr:class I SAM-dependent methyltransferase [Nitrospira sp.]